MANENLQRLTVRTIWASELAVAQYLKTPLIIHPKSTLDSVRNNSTVFPQLPSVETWGMEIVEAYDALTDTDEIRYQYVGIGIGAHGVSVAGPLNIPTYKILPHRCTDAGLFRWIPFIVRPIDEDLDAQERAQYRYRRTLQIGGDLYVAYYLRKLDLSAATAETAITQLLPTGEVTQPFVPTDVNLIPQAPQSATSSGGVRLTHTVPLSLILTEADILELQNVATLLYGDTSILMVSEIAFCAGLDKPITGRYPTSGTQNPQAIAGGLYKEAVGVRVSAFFCALNPLASAENMTMELNLGGGEPLYGAEYPVG